jgi:hypothetical protein
MSGGLAIPWRRLVVWRARTLAGRRGGLQFGVLGPLKVTQAGRPLDLGRPKPRAVLALLLLEAQTGSCRSTACGVTNRRRGRPPRCRPTCPTSPVGARTDDADASGANRARKEIDAQLRRVGWSAQVESFAAPEARRAWDRVAELCEEAGHTSQLLAALSGQWVSAIMRGDDGAAWPAGGWRSTRRSCAPCAGGPGRREADPVGGTAEMVAALTEIAASGRVMSRSWLLGLLADAHRCAGRLDDAMAAVDEALAVMELRAEHSLERCTTSA